MRAVTPAQGSGDASSKRTLTVSPDVNVVHPADRPPHARRLPRQRREEEADDRKSHDRADRGGEREGEAGEKAASRERRGVGVWSRVHDEIREGELGAGGVARQHIARAMARQAVTRARQQVCSALDASQEK